MSTTAPPGRSANLIGSLWMIASMAAFSVEDVLLKTVAEAIPIGQILMLFGAGGVLIFAGVARARGERLVVPDLLSAPMLARAVFEIIGRLFYILAIALIPLSAATVILQATPLVVVLGAVVVFGEKVGWRRWLAILIGLLGVLIILQPGTEGFSTLSLLAVIGMLGFAARDLASRKAPTTVTATLLGLYGFIAVIVAGSLYTLWDGTGFVRINPQTACFLVAATCAGATAYVCLMKAMRTGEVAAVTPFRYTRLLFGVGLGVTIFGETLTPASIIGSMLIVLSGLFILWRGQHQGKDT